jgi:HlyD family secretion protein
MNVSVSTLRTPTNDRRAAWICLVMMGALLTAGCSKGDSSEVATLVTVQAQRPEIGEISEHIMADATLSPLAQAAISPKITAPVKTFYVQRGSKVKAGQLLAILENRDLTAQALDNKGQYTAAQAAFDMQTKAQVTEDYRKSELDVAQAKAQLQLQKEIVASRKKLLEEGAIAGRDYDTAVAALVQAQAAYDVAENHFNALQKVSQHATIKQAEGQLSSAKGKYEAAQAQVSYSEIHSPITGVVTDRPLFPGETATSGNTLITVMDTTSLLAKVHLAQTLTQRLSVGDDAAVIVPGTDAPVPAKVSLISPALDPGSTTVEVWLRVDNRNGKYKAGTPVRTSITGRTIPKAIKVPISAVLTAQDGTKSVMVVGSDGAAHKTTVEVGINDGGDIQITRGLNGSEIVITTGAYGLDDGTKVKIGKPEQSDEKSSGDAK